MSNIRPIASAAALEAVTQIHAEAFRESLHIRLGTTYVRRMLEWFAEGEPRIALAAYDNQGRVVGYVLGAPLDQLSAMSRRLMPVALRGLLRRPGALLNSEFRRVCFRRLKSLFVTDAAEPPLPELEQPTMSLVGIGVAQSAQGHGVGRALVEEFVAAAARIGARSLELTVRRENAGALRLYEHAGWTRTDAPGELAATVRYVKRIDPLSEMRR